jgi:hypothetical protein
MIIVTGDSWACGEWDDHIVKHYGLVQYLRDYGKSTISLGVGGSSNYQAFLRLEQFLNSGINDYLVEQIELILFFQTDWSRDYQNRFSYENDTNCPIQYRFKNYNTDLAQITISQWQYCLVNLANKFKIKIGLIGGCSDTMWLDQFEKEYPGLFIACQSMTNLCINKDHRVSDPVQGFYHQDLISVIKPYINNLEIMDFLSKEIEKSESRLELWKKNPNLFWPDGTHGNRLAHKLLFDHLCSMKYI